MLERLKSWFAGPAASAVSEARASLSTAFAAPIAAVEESARNGDPGLTKARAAIEQGLSICPEDANLNYQMGLIYLADNDALGALDFFHLALHSAPDLFNACAARVRALLALGRAAEEPAAYREFLLANPGHPDAAYALARCFNAQGEYALAAELLRPLVEGKLADRDACNLLGIILGREFGQFEEAERLLRRSLEPDPLWPAAACNLGWILLEKGDYEQGMKLIDAVLQRDPNDSEVRLIRGYMNLKRGEFDLGWRDYEARHLSRMAVARPYRFARWDGTPIPGRHLLLFGEQGLGDEIMFASCFNEAMQRTGSCTIAPNPKLVALFQRSFASARIRTNVQTGEQPEWLTHDDPIDYQIPMGSLPGFLRRHWDEFPRHAGYLRADPERVEFWRAKLAELGPGPKIGISWRGGVKATRRHMRSVTLPELLPVLRLPARFVSLQYGECAEDLSTLAREHGAVLPHWPNALEDYDETAALVVALDLVVSVCTAVVHLAGALGKPVWILAPVVPEWRYLDRGTRLPWYPSARVFRQAEPGQWGGVIGQVVRQFPELQDKQPK